MANTLKFGNGEWYGKKDTILAYNDENSNYKPLPFDFSRDSKATVVNKDGLIETVGSGEPRIDYKDDSKGALLLEPSRSNYVLYSETEGIIKSSNGWGGDAIVTQNYGTAPYNGNELKSTRVQFGGSNKQLRNVFSALTMIPTCSIWIKGISGETIKFGSNSNEGIFTLNGDWQYITQTGSSISTDRLVINTYSGTTARDIEIYAPQLEQGSYATSYIPTQGSIGTRLADVCNGVSNEQVFNDSEGVLFAESKALANDETSRVIASISNGSSSSNRLVLQYTNLVGGNEIVAFAQAPSGYSSVLTVGITNALEYNKFAVVYDDNQNNFDLWVNGEKLGNGGFNHSFTPSELNTIKLAGITSNPLYGKIKQLKYLNTALTDVELKALTT